MPDLPSHPAAGVDVLVVGGGPAGLSAAITLARSLRSVVVIDAGEPRNARSGSARNVVTRDGSSPAHLLELARSDAHRYGARVVHGCASRAHRGGDGSIVVELDDGEQVGARRVLLATGLVDQLPDVPGISELWGSDVLHCAYCHGWEVRDRRIGVLGTSAGSARQALIVPPAQSSGHVPAAHRACAGSGAVGSVPFPRHRRRG